MNKNGARIHKMEWKTQGYEVTLGGEDFMIGIGLGVPYFWSADADGVFQLLGRNRYELFDGVWNGQANGSEFSVETFEIDGGYGLAATVETFDGDEWEAVATYKRKNEL